MYRFRLTLLVLSAGSFVTAAPADAQMPLPSSTDAPVANFEPEAARGEAFSLTLREMMRGNEIVGQSPTGVSWTDDSRWIYFRWLPAGHDFDANRELWRIPAAGGEPELIEDPLEADSLSLTFGGGDISPDRRWRATSWRGDLFLVDRRDLSVRRLTETQQNQGSPRFSANGSALYFSQGGQVHSLDLENGTVRQLTDVRSGAPSDDPDPQGHHGYLQEQQQDLFEYIRRMQARREQQQEIQERRGEQGLQAVYTGRGWNPSGLNIDTHGRYVALQANQPAQNTRQVMVPRWVTEDGYTAGDNVRTKVGDGTGRSRMGIHPVGSDSIHWPDFAEAVKGHLDGGETVGPFVPEQLEQVAEGEVEPTSIGFRGWNDAGTHGLVSATSNDNKHRWIFSVEAASGELTVLEHLADSAWVAGPCFNCMGWIPDSDRVYYVSEAERFANLYSINADGSDGRALTEGEWEVHQVTIPEQRTHFYLRTNEGSPFDQHFYRMEFDGSNRTRITSGEGNFAATVSPDGERMAVIHSTITRPPELFVAENRPGAALEQVTVSPTDEWLGFPWIDAEIIHFEARDGTMVPARIYRPSDFGVAANGGAVLFVHGAGYLQNVHRWWSTYYREYMFHHFLAAQGFTVLDVDYRGSAGYGRDWRTAIYRHMGGWDLSDYTDSVDWLVANEGVDRNRIGLYGGSYGGFLTLMALFTEPDVFHAGAALRSVTDWAHYNQGYTSRILNLPQDDPEAYYQSSPIYHAEGLRGHLLMGHPMYDTNVHFSDIVRLTQRLVELGKENWELSVFPTENHGMTDPWSWTDQYRRIYELFWSTLSAPGCPAGRGMCEVPVYANDR
jgi:dipeptidyl aminopeptidase/acylaminoacyl peptidase